MTWRQCITEVDDPDGVRDRFEALFMAHGGPRDWALFGRLSEDRTANIYLLTPIAAENEDSLTGVWMDCDDPAQFGWALCIGQHDALARFDLQTETEKNTDDGVDD